jgi:hypothetical protein
MKKLVLALTAAIGLSAAAVGTADAIGACDFIACKYGAIAYNMANGARGYSYGYDSAWKAKNTALNYCGWGGCKVYVTFKNTCGALATDNAKGIYGWGTNDNKHQAMDRALYECKVRGGNCGVRVWACSNA